MSQLPVYILDELKRCCFLHRFTEQKPVLGVVEQELVDLGYLATLQVEPEGLEGWAWFDYDYEFRAKVYETVITSKGRSALLANIHPSVLIILIQNTIDVGEASLVDELIVGLPKKFLPELLSSNSIVVQEAARARLHKLNGLERRPT